MIDNFKTNTFSDAYLENCFVVWFSMGQQSNLELIHEAIPEAPNGEKPSKTTLVRIRDTYGWRERADALTALATQKNDALLVNNKAEMLRELAQEAKEIREKAKAQMMQDGFDTSASAVNAYFKASEQEMTVRGVSEMVIKISKMSNEELESRRIKLLRRQNELVEGEIIDSESIQGENNG